MIKTNYALHGYSGIVCPVISSRKLILSYPSIISLSSSRCTHVQDQSSPRPSFEPRRGRLASKDDDYPFDYIHCPRKWQETLRLRITTLINGHRRLLMTVVKQLLKFDRWYLVKDLFVKKLQSRLREIQSELKAIFK